MDVFPSVIRTLINEAGFRCVPDNPDVSTLHIEMRKPDGGWLGHLSIIIWYNPGLSVTIYDDGQCLASVDMSDPTACEQVIQIIKKRHQQKIDADYVGFGR